MAPEKAALAAPSVFLLPCQVPVILGSPAETSCPTLIGDVEGYL